MEPRSAASIFPRSFWVFLENSCKFMFEMVLACWQEVLVLGQTELSPLKKLIVVDMLGFSAEPNDQVDVEKARIRSTQEMNCNGPLASTSIRLCIRIQPWKVRHNKWAFQELGPGADPSQLLMTNGTRSDQFFFFWGGTSTYFNYNFFWGSMILSHCQIGIGGNSGHNRLVSFSWLMIHDQIPIISSLNRWDWMVMAGFFMFFPSILQPFLQQPSIPGSFPLGMLE